MASVTSDDPIELLGELIRVPSVNPMGRAVEGPIWRETRLSAFLLERLGRGPYRVDVQEVEPGRTNILATLPGAQAPGAGGRWLLWDVHQDTVPVDGMIVPPFDGVREGGRTYGRGACDVKGSMAAMLVALDRLREVPAGKRPTVTLVLTVNEEFGFAGATVAASALAGGALYPALPDAAIVAEPTDFRVVIAHKGVVRWRVRTLGTACHSSAPSQGDNAVYRMARVVTALETYAGDVVGGLGRDERLGEATLSVGTISGGVSVNTVPDACTIEIDRRVLPDENPLDAKAHAEAWLRERLPDDRVVHDAPLMVSRGLKPAGAERLAESVLAVAREAGVVSETCGVPYGTDAPAYASRGVPAVVWGPGSIAQAHTKDEWIEEDAVRAYVELLVEHALRFAQPA